MNEWQGASKCRPIGSSLLLKTIASKFVEKDIYKGRNAEKMMLQFLNGCCNVDYEDQTNMATLFAIAVALEMIYFIRNFNLVLPHCFAVNLLRSFTSGSKTVSTLNGKS